MAEGMGKNRQKRELAFMLTQAAGTILEFWGERAGQEDIDPEFARECFARWLKDLPGDAWDIRLGERP